MSFISFIIIISEKAKMVLQIVAGCSVFVKTEGSECRDFCFSSVFLQRDFFTCLQATSAWMRVFITAAWVRAEYRFPMRWSS